MPRAAARENEQLAARASSEAPMALFQHLACEFPLLRDAYWSSGASSTPASSPFRHSNRSTPAQGASTPAAQRLSWAAAAADAALEQRSVSPNKRHSGIGSVSVDLGSALRGRGSGATQGDDVMPPVPELQRSESVADSVPRARFGLRSLDLQVRSGRELAAGTHLAHHQGPDNLRTSSLSHPRLRWNCLQLTSMFSGAHLFRR